MLVGVEIWLKSFSTPPRARVRVGIILAAILLVTALAAHAIPAELHPYDALIGVLCPRQNAGALTLLAAIVVAAHWYSVPLHPFHRGVLIGFAASGVAFTLALSYLGSHMGSSSVYGWLAPIPAAIYTLTELWWVWAAWRPLRPPCPVASRLQPWATTW